jgi:hypothetical protein
LYLFQLSLENAWRVLIWVTSAPPLSRAAVRAALYSSF